MSVDRTIRRHLGTNADLQDFDAEESTDFFKSLAGSKVNGAHLQWQTIRASLVKKLTEKQIKSHAAKIDIEELPMSVLLQRGWQEETVRRFPSYESPEYGCEVFKVPIKKQTWKQVFESVEERILEREKQASKKRGAQAADLDVPVAAGPSGQSSEKQEDGRKQQPKRRNKRPTRRLRRWRQRAWDAWHRRRRLSPRSSTKARWCPKLTVLPWLSARIAWPRSSVGRKQRGQQ